MHTHTHTHTHTLTVNNNSSCSATSFGHNVLCHTCVVGCVRQTCLFDDQVVVDGDIKVSVLCWVNYLFVLQPLHLVDSERTIERFLWAKHHLWGTIDNIELQFLFDLTMVRFAVSMTPKTITVFINLSSLLFCFTMLHFASCRIL